MKNLRLAACLALLATFLLGMAILGCGRQPPGLPPSKAPEVIVTSPVAKEVTNYEEFTGRTDAVAGVEVRARVTGYLEKVNFKEGMLVKQGETLFEIDPRPYKAELNRAEANVVLAEAHLKRLNLDFRRAEGLVGTRAISREDFDRVAGDRDEASAAVKVAEAARDLARLNLSFTKVAAPLSGRISRRLIDPGNMVKADDTPLTSIVSLDPIYAYFDVDERTVLKVRRLIREGKVKSAREAEAPVLLGLVDEQGFPHVGTINFVDNRVDPMTGTLRIRGVFPNPKEFLAPGLFARVRVQIGTPHRAVLLAERALGSDQGEKFVYVVNAEHKVVYRRVKVGSIQEGLRVIEDGLEPGEQVVLSGLQRIRPGVEVEPKKDTAPASASTPSPSTTVSTNLTP